MKAKPIFVQFAHNERKINQLVKLGYIHVTSDDAQFEYAMAGTTKYHNFVVFGEVDIKQLLIIGVWSGILPKNSFVRRFYRSAARYLKEPQYLNSRNQFVKELLYFDKYHLECVDEDSLWENIDLLTGIIECRNDPNWQAILDQEYNAFQEECAKKHKEAKLLELGLKVTSGVGVLPAKDFRDVISAHAFAGVVVTLLNERVVVSVKDTQTSKKLFGENGLRSLISILNNVLSLELESDKTVATLAHQKRGRTETNTYKDCEKAAALIAATM